MVRDALATTILVAALWFTGVQAFVLHQWCVLCCGIHLIASVGAVLVLMQHRLRSWPMLGSALATIAVLAITAPRSSIEVSQLVVVTADELQLLHGQHRLPLSDVPRLGDAEATKSLMVLMNYACTHCVQLMKHLREVIAELLHAASMSILCR